MEEHMVEDYLFIMEQEFHGAIKNGEFHVWYQPQIDMRTGKHCGAEALVRWQKQDGSLVRPDAFVPPLEELGLIVRLDEEVLENVCRDISQARKQGVALGPVSVNLSRLQAGRRGITRKLKRITEEYEITREELFFEITETADEGEDGLPGFVEQMRENGFQIAMDDFGTGNSSLKALQESCFDILKLDRYFVARIGDPKAEIILASTIAMAKKLGLEVVAEGVETEEQICFLLGHQCYLAQGYYYSGPLTKEQYIKWQQVWDSCVAGGIFRERELRI